MILVFFQAISEEIDKCRGRRYDLIIGRLRTVLSTINFPILYQWSDPSVYTGDDVYQRKRADHGGCVQ